MARSSWDVPGFRLITFDNACAAGGCVGRLRQLRSVGTPMLACAPSPHVSTLAVRSCLLVQNAAYRMSAMPECSSSSCSSNLRRDRFLGLLTAQRRWPATARHGSGKRRTGTAGAARTRAAASPFGRRRTRTWRRRKRAGTPRSRQRTRGDPRSRSRARTRIRWMGAATAGAAARSRTREMPGGGPWWRS